MARFRAADRRVAIEAVTPQVDCGRFPVKRVVGDPVVVTANVFADGHDAVACALRFRPIRSRSWTEVRMESVGNDRWQATFTPVELGTWQFEIIGWVDHFRTWLDGLEKKVGAGVDVAPDLLIGSKLVAGAASRAKPKVAKRLTEASKVLGDEVRAIADRLAEAFSDSIENLMDDHPDRSRATTSDPRLEVFVDRERAVFSTWYELFPRSWSPTADEHGTFADVEAELGYVAGMGYDVLYLPPIHPIGVTNRKGPNNSLEAGPDAPGVPWAIGSDQRGHTDIEPKLGTIAEFTSLRDKAVELGIELALDIAFQCSPDHPWVTEHPEWFRHRPDGTIQYAENPPKKYEDIYPLDFETSDAEGLWLELRGVFEHWIGQGIRIFRVDNPHTKAFPFWEWLIAELRADHPDVILLSEAFTRPAVMRRLAKLGFNQSYTYFAWRNSKHELVEYMADLAEAKEYFRPNFWPNTPDILTEFMQTGERPAFITRYVLAATLSASCGIYGPAYELMESSAIRPGSEEYLQSEKYQIRNWDLRREDSLAPVIARVNRARHSHPALQSNENLVFHHTANDMLLCYSKRAQDDVVLVAVNLDAHHTQSGWIELDTNALGIDRRRQFQVHDVLTDRRYLWEGARNFVELDPTGIPAHIFSIRTPTRTERNLDSFA